MNITDKFQFAYQKIKDAQKVLIITHLSPDADALASCGAFFNIIEKLGLEAQAYAGNKPLGAYGFIPYEEQVLNQPPENLAIFDLIIILDCGSLARTGLEREIQKLLLPVKNNLFAGTPSSRPYLIEFDHHEPQDHYADLEIRLPEKAATVEIIYEFLKVNQILIDKTLANCILIGLLGDTGNFLHANVSPAILEVSAEMLLQGASFPMIIQETTRNKSFASLKIWGRALEKLKYNPATGLAVSALTARELDELMTREERQLVTDLFSDIVSFLSGLAGVRVALFLREEGNQVKGSLRTNQADIDVAKIARQFSGGGHKKAAGFSVPGRLAETSRGWKVIDLLD